MVRAEGQDKGLGRVKASTNRLGRDGTTPLRGGQRTSTTEVYPRWSADVGSSVHSVHKSCGEFWSVPSGMNFRNV